MGDRRNLKRIFGYMQSEDLADALREAGCAVSGTKEERIERIIEAIFEGNIEFGDALGCAYKTAISEMCDDLDLRKSGTKDDIIDNMCEWFEEEFGDRVKHNADDDEDSDDEEIDDREYLKELFLFAYPDLDPPKSYLKLIDENVNHIFNKKLKLESVLKEKSKEQLIDMCDFLSEKTSGTKEELFLRIINKLKEDIPQLFEDNTKSKVSKKIAKSSKIDDKKPGTQGRPDHKKLQNSLIELGTLRGYHVKTNYSIGAGFKPDVLWYRLNPDEHKAAPIKVFEIEFGSAQAIAKSLSSLKHAFDLGAQELFLILPSDRVSGASLRLGGAFHEIARSIRVLPVEKALPLNSMELAKFLGVL